MTYRLIAFLLLSLWLNNRLQAQFDIHEEPQLIGEQKIKAISADWNLDGLNDIIYSSEDSSGISLYLSINEGDRQFSNAITLVENSLATAHSFQIVDGDQNGLPDLLLTHQDSQCIRIMLQVAAAEFEDIWIPINTPHALLDMEFMDVDGDADIDIVYTNYEELSLHLLLNTGNNTYSPPLLLSQGYCGNNDLQFFDSDEDGDPDLLMANYCSEQLVFLENLGQGFFEEQNLTNVPLSGNFNLEILDVDEDGKKDVLVTVWNDAEVVWLRNLGNNSFSDPMTLFNQISPNQLLAADLDSDGRKDLVCSSWTGGIQWFKNMGEGAFEWQESLETGFDFISSLYTERIDEDEAVDLLIAERDAGTITVFYNEIEQVTSSFITKEKRPLQFSPNPSTGPVQFSHLQEGDAALSLELYDLSGQIQQKHDLRGKDEFKLHIAQKGQFIFTIQYKNGFKTGQLIIQ